MRKDDTSEHALEKTIETRCVDWARSRGWLSRKYQAPTRRGSPDRIFMRNGVVVWIEIKRKGKEPTELQWREIRLMRAAGLNVYWVDDLEDAKAVLAAHEGPA
jgi:hypothetical protein